MSKSSASALAAAPTADPVAALTAIWEKVLDAGSVRPNQDFFDLGGNSVLMIAMLDLVQQEFGRDIDIAKLVDMGATGVTIDLLAGLLC